MAENGTEETPDAGNPSLRDAHAREDKYGKKYLDTANKVHATVADKKSQLKKDGGEEKKGPAGGFDGTPIPSAPPGYTVKFTFHKATNLPFADINSLSSDPFIVATLKTNLEKRHKQDPDMTWRTPTIRRNVNPVWDNEWIVANVPASGFYLKCRLYDEDPADYDDRLGNVSVRVDSISEQWSGIDNIAYKIKKRMGSKRAYLVRACAAMVRRDLEMSGEVFLSVQVLGKTESDNGGHIYTTGPNQWTRHYSPMIGRLAGTKDNENSADGQHSTEKYNFQAVQIQLSGPVPPPLYHRYVEFKAFVAGMFTGMGLRGWLLNRALHHQHSRIYNFDRTTRYGTFDEPSIDMTKLFLDFVHYDQGGRIFTYVITLDGQWRFTETGKEFGVDLLSKHTMHSDVAIYIAFSGEFFIRRLKHPHRDKSRSPDPESAAMPPAPEPEDEAAGAEKAAKDPQYYELIIDNDSGTYRPNAKYLSTLKEFLTRNLPGLRVVTLDCQGDEEEMTKLKNEQRDKKKKTGKQITYMQNLSESSLSSSDEERLDQAGQGGGAKSGGKVKRLGKNIKNPKAAVMAAAADAAGPSSAVEHHDQPTEEKVDHHDEKQDISHGGDNPAQHAETETETEKRPEHLSPETANNEKPLNEKHGIEGENAPTT